MTRSTSADFGLEKGQRRSSTISLKQMLFDRRAAAKEPKVDLGDALEEACLRPTTRGDCAGGGRPCPFVTCRYNLFLDVTEYGAIKLNHPGIEPDEMVVSCALDVADAGGETLERVGAIMNLTRERTRQIEDKALVRLRIFPIDDFDDNGTVRTPCKAHQAEEQQP